MKRVVFVVLLCCVSFSGLAAAPEKNGEQKSEEKPRGAEKNPATLEAAKKFIIDNTGDPKSIEGGFAKCPASPYKPLPPPGEAAHREFGGNPMRIQPQIYPHSTLRFRGLRHRARACLLIPVLGPALVARLGRLPRFHRTEVVSVVRQRAASRWLGTQTEKPDGGSQKMAGEVCSSLGCERNPLVRSYLASRRKVVAKAVYCEEHAEAFLANYNLRNPADVSPPLRWEDTVGFDVELVILHDRPGGLCWFSMRELGGSRRVDVQIGIFEAAALQRELERYPSPRPLTHSAMASTIKALGGRLERVVIDKFFPGQNVAYEAKLHVQQMGATVLVDVRPSDAVVLAVVCDVPIAVADGVLASLADMDR